MRHCESRNLRTSSIRLTTNRITMQIAEPVSVARGACPRAHPGAYGAGLAGFRRLNARSDEPQLYLLRSRKHLASRQ